MRSKNVILFLVLFAVQIYSTQFDFSQLVEVKELNSDQYANSLIQTINTELNAKGGKIETIQNLLTELQNKLVQDYFRARKQWYERERSLNITIFDTNAEIVRLAEQIALANKKLALTNQKIHRAQINIQQYAKQLTEEKHMVYTLDLKRKQDEAIYRDNIYNNQNLIMALDQVMIALRKLRGSISGVARPGHVNELKSEIRDRQWKKAHGGALLQIFSEEDIDNFVQIATEADQDGLSKLLGLLESLHRSATKSLVDFHNDEAGSEQAYKVLRAKLRHDIEKLEGIHSRQERNLKAYLSLRNELTVEINEKTKLKKKNEAFLKATIETRRVENLRYLADQRQRDKEKSIIRRLEKIVNEKLAKINAFVKSKVN